MAAHVASSASPGPDPSLSSGPDRPVPAAAERTVSPATIFRALALVALGLAVATIAAAILEDVGGLADASPVYLVPVVVVASLYGTWPAIGTSLLGFLAYDFLFTTPRFTFAVADPAEWLSLLLFLLIAVVIGRLTALLRERAEIADRRSRETIAIATIGRAIAMGTSFEDAAIGVADRLRLDTEMASLSIERGDTAGRGPRDTAAGGPVTVVSVGAIEGEGSEARARAAGSTDSVPWTLLRSATDGSTDWVRIVGNDGARDAGDGTSPATASLSGDDRERYLVPIEADGVRLGAIRASRLAGDPRPGRGARRILSVTADQLGMAIRRDELRAEITTSEVARQGEALRGAILDSVSHDLRTPLATIRALAGGLLDDAAEPTPTSARAAAEAIDAEAARLAELVRDLLDMGRIQAGAVQPDVAAYDVAELVETAIRHLGSADAPSRIRVRLPADAPPVAADAVLFDVALTNVLDNALRYAPPPAEVAVSVEPEASTVAVHVDDAGPGVPADALPLLFDRFYRVPGPTQPARHGIGMGLAIARGFVEAIGGSIEASRSDLGGLRLTIRLRAASLPDDADEDNAATGALDAASGALDPTASSMDASVASDAP